MPRAPPATRNHQSHRTPFQQEVVDQCIEGDEGQVVEVLGPHSPLGTRPSSASACRDHAEVAAGQSNGHSWARTSDLRLVEAALSQLSYAPGEPESSSGAHARGCGSSSPLQEPMKGVQLFSDRGVSISVAQQGLGPTSQGESISLVARPSETGAPYGALFRCAQPRTWTTTVLSRGRSSKSTRTTCCQVPRARRPPLTGTVWAAPTSDARWCACELVSWLSRLCS